MPAPAPRLVEDRPDAPTPLPGDARRGKVLLARYECARCHEGTGQPAPFFERQCVGCHERVLAGQLPFPRARLDAWRATMRHYLTTPSLDQASSTLTAAWIRSFLREPTKVRPHMQEWMPRLPISDADAADLAAALTAKAPAPGPSPAPGDARRGAELAVAKGCFACHEFSGAARAADAPSIPDLPQTTLGTLITRAPDLRVTRERFRPDVLARWIQDPKQVAPGALMPTIPMSEDDARDLATYVLATPLAEPPAPPPVPDRLPGLDRKVSFKEVSDRVFRKSCIHCHEDQDAKGGDTGPGNGGGMGFAPRGISFSSYDGFRRGVLTRGGGRRGLGEHDAALDAWGGSLLVASLTVRHAETSGQQVPGVRGMPLGLPGLSAEDIQLVESWVAQGAPR
jgi:cytochrome c2